ncbi:MAG: hypothetical protein IJB85_08080 [Clostridia bacterium]|nr:hypothetical protein [Clostridia bacterium]
MKIIRLLRRCHLPALLLLSAGALAVQVLSPFAPEAAARLALFPPLCMLLLMLCAAVPGRLRLIALGACFAALCGAGFWLLPHMAALYAMPLCCALMLFAALSHVDRSPAEAAPVFYVASVVMQIITLFTLHHSARAIYDVLSLPLQGMFLLWLLLLLLAFNRISLNNATLSRYRLSAGMARAGTALTVCMFSLALLLCAMPAVVQGIRWIFRTLRNVSVYLLLLLINLFADESVGGFTEPGVPMRPQSMLPAPEDPSLLAVILERIASLVSMAVLIVGAVFFVRLLVRTLARLMRRLIDRLQRYAAAVTEDYEDEITDTRGEDGERSFHPLRRRVRQAAQYPATPVGRIRRRYAQLLARHPAWPVSSTARENLSPNAASLYERARYSDHEITDEDAQRFERDA